MPNKKSSANLLSLSFIPGKKVKKLLEMADEDLIEDQLLDNLDDANGENDLLNEVYWNKFIMF